MVRDTRQDADFVGLPNYLEIGEPPKELECIAGEALFEVCEFLLDERWRPNRNPQYLKASEIDVAVGVLFNRLIEACDDWFWQERSGVDAVSREAYLILRFIEGESIFRSQFLAELEKFECQFYRRKPSEIIH